ncbi:hypothetical protein N431DRAFT_376507 [Stipitochalara longipes BDJ]|nr:hypothetical protein N431DRAFT_376507 [Stipitochalara longipes BDJ]
MADSIGTVLQAAERIANVCKWLIETVHDYPKDLRLVFIETGSLKVIFESLRFLNEDDSADSATLQRLRGSDGPVEGCKVAMEQLDQLFPLLPSLTSKSKGKKRQKLQTALISLAWPLKAERARKLLDEIMCHKATINVALQGQLLAEFRNIKHQLDEVYVTLDTSEKRKVYDWLQDTNPSEAHNRAKHLYENKTGDWVFTTPHWSDWINSRIRALWIHGIPGAGKTILAGHITEKTLLICEENDKRTTCVYYYCYHVHNQDESMPFLRWLLSQLLREAGIVPTLTWKAYKKNTVPAARELFEILQTILDSFDLVYVLVDALDESQSRENLLHVLNILATDPRFSKIQLLATSRMYRDIELEMSLFSQSLSMSNSFVEADIKIYVAAKIKDELKFKDWPDKLRTEVEETLSTGAKGMFRWAVCQLDILRRLHSESKIRTALKSLPKTIYETYERIFSYFTEEEKDFVRHTLHWVCFHGFLWKGSVPLAADVLVDAYIAFEDGLHQGGSRSSGHFYGIETLKYNCGCLVSFTRDSKTGKYLADVAHYTVREFLESDEPSSKFWSINQTASYSSILAFAMEYAITSELTKASRALASTLRLRQYTLNLQQYCLASSVRFLRNYEDLVEPGLASRFLDPSEAHFDALHTFISDLDSSDDAEILNCDHNYTGFWDVNWQESSKKSKATILAHLILMSSFTMAKEFVQDLNLKHILQETLRGSVSDQPLWRNPMYSGGFECNLVEFLMEIREFNTNSLEFFLQEAPGLVSYTNLLPLYMPGHDPFGKEKNECKHTCVLPRLLRLGADPDPKGFQVTPLQIAVFSRDLVGVKTLLKAGANPNNAGDTHGISWDAKTSILGPYHLLHGRAPLDILRQLEAYLYYQGSMLDSEIDLMNGEMTTGIERLLLDYGANVAPIEDLRSERILSLESWCSPSA